jgi:predicted DNA-binding transcriptional regulator YafY
VLDTSARLLRLLALLQARRFWSGADLAARLEVTERTVRRDVDRLRSLGYPVHSSTGVAGGYQLGAGASLPPLLLDDAEALAVALGLRIAAAGTVAGIDEAVVRALAKLEQVLPSRLRKRVRALHSAVASLSMAGPPVDAEILSTLAAASRDETVVRFRYADARGRTSNRTVEPHGVVHTGPRWYIAAWDRSRDDWRVFRVDRISGKVTTERRFVRRDIPGGDLAAFVARSITTDPYAVRGRVLFHAPRERIAQRVPPSIARVTALDDERCVLEAGSTSARSLALHVALLGEEFEVLEPEELRAEVRTLAERLARATARA